MDQLVGPALDLGLVVLTFIRVSYYDLVFHS